MRWWARGRTQTAPWAALVVLAAQDFGCLPSEVEEKLTDEQFHVWLTMKEAEADKIKALEKAG